MPDPLRELDFALSAGLAADIVDVEHRVRSLGELYPNLADLEPLARFLLRAEAVASSNIEGLSINVRRLARSEVAEAEGLPVTDDTAKAVLGNIWALQHAVQLAANSEAPFTLERLTELHAALLRGTRDEHWGGQVRTEQNWIGGLNPCNAAFVPPPEDDVLPLLADLCAYVSADDHPALLQAAVAHAQFETIHPFADGNGRTGRALIQLVLRRRGVMTRVLPPISLVLATQSGRYVAALNGTRTGGDVREGMLDWLHLFLQATSQACDDAGRLATDLAALDVAARTALGKVRATSALDLLVSALPSMPVFTVRTAADGIHRSYQATNLAVDRLVAAGVVRQTRLGRTQRVFEATAVLDAFTGFERALASPDRDTAMTPPARPVPARRR